jgi:hypothetical protein
MLRDLMMFISVGLVISTMSFAVLIMMVLMLVLS